jgi:hypothetical protein
MSSQKVREFHITDTIAFLSQQSRGRIAHWMLEEVNAPYEIKVVDFEKKEHSRPTFWPSTPWEKFLPSFIAVPWSPSARPSRVLGRGLSGGNQPGLRGWLFVLVLAHSRRSTGIGSRTSRK